MKKSELKTGALLSYAGLVLGIIISLIYTPYMLRKLGQSEYGLYSLVNAVVANLTILDFGFGNAVIRYTAKYRAEENWEKERSMHFMFFVLYSLIGLAALAIGLLLITNIDMIFKASLTSQEVQTARTLMLIAVVNVAISFPLSIFGAILQAYEKFIFLRGANLLRLILNPLIMSGILLMGYRSGGILLATTVLSLLFNLFNVVYSCKVLNKRIRVSKFDTRLLRNIGQYSFFVFLNLLIDRLYWATDQLILGIYVGTAAVSVYTIGAQFTGYFQQLSTSLSGIFLPRVVEIQVRDKDGTQLSDLFLRVGRLQFMILAFVLGGFALFGQEFISLWAGPGYGDAYFVAMIVLTTSIIPLSQNIGISILQAKNMHAFRSISYLFIALLNVILSILLVKPFGVIGCATATGFGTIMGQIITMNLYYKRKVGLDINAYWVNAAKLSFPAVIAVLFGITLNSLWQSDGPIRLLMKIILYSAVFLMILWFKGLNRSEKNLIMDPITRLRHKR